MRIDDLDPDRSSERWAARQLEELADLGLGWDAQALRQSERHGAYEAAIAQLNQAGLLYPCFCTRREIREAASAPHGDRPEGFYPGTCFALGADERDRRLAAGEPAALRVHAAEAWISFEDRIQGTTHNAVDDFVVRRKDGTHGYNLAVVVDDAHQEITQVVRGADLASSTPRHLWLCDQLGLEPPSSWAHVPLVLGDDGERLAKRHGAITLDDLERDGVYPTDVRTLLAISLGLCETGESPSPQELVDRFDPDALPTEDGPLPT